MNKCDRFLQRWDRSWSIPLKWSVCAGIMLVVSMAGCSKMDGTYNDFWKNGGKTYPASPDSITVFSGKNRIKMALTFSGGSLVTKAKIYWNNKADSLVVPIQRDEDKPADTIDMMLKDLDEGFYSFDVYTYDDKGNQSVTKNAIGYVYGAEYTASLLSRLIEQVSYSDDTAKIQWDNRADSTAIGAEILYKGASGTIHRRFVAPTADTTVITDMLFSPGDVIYSRTLYVPDSTCIDTFYTAYDTVKIIGPPVEVSKDAWQATASVEDAKSGRVAANIIDNDQSTMWFSGVGAGQDYPYTITIDMGQTWTDVYGFTFVQRTAFPMETIELHVSNDGQQWQSMGSFVIPKTGGMQYIDFFQPQSFRYLKVTCIQGYAHDDPGASIMEVGVFTR